MKYQIVPSEKTISFSVNIDRKTLVSDNNYLKKYI